MNKIRAFIKSISLIQWIAAALILGGLAIMIPRALGMRSMGREVRYAIENNFEAGNPSPDLIRPWMSIRYVAANYGVPQKYLMDAASIPVRKETSLLSIKRLNEQMGLGRVDDQPELIGTFKKAVLAYRADPVHPGLLERRVEDWMTVQYVANSTGISAEQIFAAIGISQAGNEFVPLGVLSSRVKYSGGPKALTQAVGQAVGLQPEGKP